MYQQFGLEQHGRSLAQAATVSIIIPAYNAEASLAAAIRAALAQTLATVEIIVVDDCSTDATAALARSFAALDPRITLLQTPARQGPAGARNLALAAATGTWIALLDADDTMVPTRLQTMVAEAERRGADFLADNITLRDHATGNILRRGFAAATMANPNPLSLPDFIQLDLPNASGSHPIGYCKPIFRRGFVRLRRLEYDRRAVVGQDFIFYCHAIALGAVFLLTPDTGYDFTIGGPSHSTGRPALLQVRDANTRLLRETKTWDGPSRAALKRRHTVLNQALRPRSLLQTLFARRVAVG